MQAYRARDMTSEPALRRSLGVAGGGYVMIIRLSCREPEPLETYEVSGDVERALPMRDEPGTHWKTGLQGRPCAG